MSFLLCVYVFHGSAHLWSCLAIKKTNAIQNSQLIVAFSHQLGYYASIIPDGRFQLQAVPCSPTSWGGALIC